MRKLLCALSLSSLAIRHSIHSLLPHFIQSTIMSTIDVNGDGVTLLYGAIVLLVTSWTIFTMRVGVRVWRKAFGMDDYLMSTGIVRVFH
jgi:hypothetical protein